MTNEYIVAQLIEHVRLIEACQKERATLSRVQIAGLPSISQDQLPCRLVKLVQNFHQLGGYLSDKPEAEALLENIRIVGRTADFFGGYEAMKKLHDAAEELVGNDNSIGYWLNKNWDGIGSWWG